MANKYLALQKDVFDISKITVVGSPTITNDGVASGFSGSSYITYGTINFNAANTWELQDCFTTGNDFSALQFYGGFGKNGNFGLGTNINTDGCISINIASGNSTWDIANNIRSTLKVNPNTTYFMKRYFTGTQYKIDLSTDNTNWINYITINSSVKVNPNATTICLGQFAGLNKPFTGSIDLTQFKIYADGQLVFQPVKPTYLLERRKEGYDSSKFTVVGSPTITEAGVASGLQANNYVETSNTITIKEKTIIKFSYNISSKTATTSVYFCTLVGLNLFIYKAGSGYFSIGQRTNYGTVLSVNAYQLGVVDFELVLENNTAICFISQNGVILGNVQLSNVNYIGDTKIRFGADQSGNYGVTSGESIDLPSFSITVDGKEVFTGAKEQFYMLRR